MSCDCKLEWIQEPSWTSGYWKRIHVPGCTFGAGLTGDEWETRASHQEGRDGVDEAMSIDYANIKKAKEKGE